MEETIINLEGGDPLKVAQTVVNCFNGMIAKIEAQENQIQELARELDRLKNDPWSSRVTYENVVELIAQNEDPAVRDETRKVFEPLLKKEQVRMLRRDVKKKVDEWEAAEGQSPEAPEPVELQVPEQLRTEAAEEIWTSLREAGFIEKNGYGLAKGVSANLATYIADHMADELGIAHKWKVFQGLWGIKNMAQLAGSWKETGKLPPRTDEIDEII
jgi:hypothetical protein